MFKAHSTNTSKSENRATASTFVLDRGYAITKMMEWLFHFNQDFIIRWKKNHLPEHHEKGCKKTHL